MLTNDGVDIHHRATGTGPNVPLLLTHGFGATSELYAPAVAALSSEQRCITWDLRGHGRSDAPEDPARYSVELAIADMVGILDAEGVDRAVAIGHSMGGYLTLELQRRHPERVAALVLVGTGPGYRRDEARATWNERCTTIAARIEANGLDGLEGSEEVRIANHRSAAGLAHVARGMLRQHDGAVIAHLPAIPVPTLVMVGSEDEPFVAVSSYLATAIPRARRVVIDGAGHPPMLTHTEAFVSELRPLLAEVNARGG